MPFAVFTSYSIGQNKNLRPKVDRFLADLRDLVQSKSGRALPECQFFMDSESIRLAGVWREELATAVRTSEALLCLMSPLYLESEWCGQELEIFERRRNAWEKRPIRRLGSGGFVFPVWWESMPGRSLPTSLEQYQSQQGLTLTKYPQLGLREILNRRLKRDYTELLEILSKRISEVLAHPGELPHAAPFSKWEELPNALESRRPFDLRWHVVVAPGSTWSDSGTTLPLGLLVNQLAGSLGCGARKFRGGSATQTSLSQARDERLVVVIVVESTQGAADSDLNTINQFPLASLVLVVVDTTSTPGTRPLSPLDWTQQNFPTGSFADAVAAGRAASSTPSELANSLESLVSSARRRLLATITPARVEDPQLAQKARSDGVPVEQKPNLQGPGGRNS